MANRWLSDVNALQKAVVVLEGSCIIASGETGKTKSLKGSGIKAITNMATGTYKVQFEDAFNRFFGATAQFVCPNATAAKIDNAALSIGNVYVISTLGNATAAQWITLGVPAGVTPAVGVPFTALATGAGTANTSTSRVMSPAIAAPCVVEVVGDPNTTINNSTDPHIYIQTLAATNASTTTLIPTDPVNDSVLEMVFFLRNSSVKGAGE